MTKALIIRIGAHQSQTSGAATVNYVFSFRISQKIRQYCTMLEKGNVFNCKKVKTFNYYLYKLKQLNIYSYRIYATYKLV